jgi:hypothetical protein
MPSTNLSVALTDSSFSEKSGKENVIDVPWTFYLSLVLTVEAAQEISQPMLTKILLHMDKPSPVPLGLSDFPFSSFVNGLNRLLMSSGFMPIPVS